jgi:hypothetical protein
VLLRASRVGRDGRLRVTLSCAAACSGKATLRAGRRALAARRFAGRAGTVRIALRLAKRERRALARAGRLRARLTIAPAGVSERLTLRRDPDRSR